MMPGWLQVPVLLGVTLLTGVMATEDPIVGVIAAGASAGGLLFLLFIVITVYCLVKQSRKSRKEVKLTKPYANGTVRNKTRVVPQQYHYHTNPVFHTQGPPSRVRPPITFYTVRHGMRDFSSPNILDPLPPYMFEPPIGYPQPIILLDDEKPKRSKRHLANGFPTGVVIREMESGEERVDLESSEAENRHRRYERNRDMSKSRGRKHDHAKREQSRSRSRESHRRRSKSRERSDSDEKVSRASQSNGAAVTAVPGDIILATPGESESNIKRQSTKAPQMETIPLVNTSHAASKTSIVSSTGFDAEHSDKSAFKTYLPKISDPEPRSVSDYTFPVPTSSLHFDYPQEAQPEQSVDSDYTYPVESSSLHFDYPQKEPEPTPISDYTPHPIQASSMHFDYPPKEPEPTAISDYTHSIQASSYNFDYPPTEPEPTAISDYTHSIQTSSMHFDYPPKEPEPESSPMSDYTPRQIPTSSLHFEYPSKSTITPQTSYTSQEQIHSFGTEPEEPFNIHGSSEFAIETPSADYAGASTSEFTTDQRPVIPKEDYQNLSDGPASEVERAFRFTDLEYGDEDDKPYFTKDNFRPPTPPFDAEASLSRFNPPTPPPPPPPNFMSVKYRQATPPPGLIRKIPDAEDERQKILGSNQSPNKNAVIEELKRMRRRQRPSDDESPPPSPVQPAWMSDNPTPPDSTTSSQHRGVQFTVSPPEIIPRPEIDSPPIDAGSFNIPPAPPPPPPPPYHTKL